MAPDAPIVVFNTDCVLCSGMARFVLAHGQASVLRLKPIAPSPRAIA